MKRQNEPQADLAFTQLRFNIRVAFAILILFFGGGLSWVVFAELSGAVIANGRLTVDTQIKRIQHPDGGIVEQIYVTNGDHVQAGQILVKLDETTAKANFEINQQRLIEAMVLESRLKAELWERQSFNLPAGLPQIDQSAVIDTVVEGQRRLLDAKLKSMQGQRDQLNQQIKQLDNRIAGLQILRDANKKRVSLITEQIETLDELLKKQLTEKSRVLALRGTQAELEGEIGRLTSEISSVRNSISEMEIQLLQLEDTRRSDLLEQIQETRAQVAELLELDLAARKTMSQIEIRAPYSGMVHRSEVHTMGQVIGPGHDLMFIVPEEDELVVEATVRPVDVDQIYIGQRAKLRMSALDARITPELTAKVAYVSAELVEDPATREQLYQIRAKIERSELDKLNGQDLLPGMPAEVYVQTTNRTVLSYLTKPLMDQINRSFRE